MLGEDIATRHLLPPAVCAVPSPPLGRLALEERLVFRSDGRINIVEEELIGGAAVGLAAL
jgi:hypothetical protein